MKTWNLIPSMLAAIAVLACLALPGVSDGLRPVSDYEWIADETERSAALFTEAGRVLQHPRCVNCHPAGDSPLQGEDGSLHEPPARRGMGGLGVVGMQCMTCHQDANFDPGRVPGAPHWLLAPRRMAWKGLSLAEICEQIKDPERNGHRTLDEIVEHLTEDALVGWGWQPGAGREPAPGTQEAFGELIRAWVETGAACPSSD
ncbi:MAG: Isoquinoline 1-oxidoreductase subunit [Thermoanaerobaculia bacterium]